MFNSRKRLARTHHPQRALLSLRVENVQLFNRCVSTKSGEHLIHSSSDMAHHTTPNHPQLPNATASRAGNVSPISPSISQVFQGRVRNIASTAVYRRNAESKRSTDPKTRRTTPHHHCAAFSRDRPSCVRDTLLQHPPLCTRLVLQHSAHCHINFSNACLAGYRTHFGV